MQIRDQIVDVLGDVLGATEDADDVDRRADFVERAHHREAEDLLHARVVDRNRDDLDAMIDEVPRDVVRGLIDVRVFGVAILSVNGTGR